MTQSPRLVVLGEAEGPRLEALEGPARALGWRVESFSWEEYLAQPGALGGRLTPGTLLRIDSPGSSPAVHAALSRIASPAPASLSSQGGSGQGESSQRGRILPRTQWYQGLRTTLGALGELLDDLPGVASMGDPREMAVMCDKQESRERLVARGVPVPEPLGEVSGWRGLQEIVQHQGLRRAFLKPRHGASASGVLAYQTDGRHHRVTTSVERVPTRHGTLLYNSLELRTYKDPGEIRELVDLLGTDLGSAPEGEPALLVERWVPKRGLPQGTFDLRVLVIAGRARHVVVRCAPGPLTNLHLGNSRGSLEAARGAVGEGAWSQGMASCEAAAAAFPGALYLGVDLAFPLGRGPARVLEVNAWGDFLPRVLHRGESCQEAELRALPVWRQAA